MSGDPYRFAQPVTRPAPSTPEEAREDREATAHYLRTGDEELLRKLGFFRGGGVSG